MREGPTEGGKVLVDADPAAGVIDIDVNGFEDGDWDGPLAGSAALGLGIQTTKNGTVTVRPYVTYDFWWLVAGFLLSATSRGHVGFFVEERGGEIVSPTWTTRLGIRRAKRSTATARPGCCTRRTERSCSWPRPDAAISFGSGRRCPATNPVQGSVGA
jgi:hypothetical protein